MNRVIDLDSVMQRVATPGITIRIDGQEYRTRQMSLADAERLARCAELTPAAETGKPGKGKKPELTLVPLYTDSENATFLAGLFDGPAPSCIDVLGNPGQRGPDAISANRARVALIMLALGVSYWEEHDAVKKRSPLLAAVREAAGIPTTTQNEPTTQEATDESDGDGSSSS